MLKLRLKRTGRRNDPSFRVVITEATAPPKGKYLESVGSYKPMLKQITLNAERIKHWISLGAQPTDAVHNILVREGIIKDSKRPVHSTRERKKKEGEIPTAETPEKAEENAEEEQEQEEQKQEEVSEKNQQETEESDKKEKPNTDVVEEDSSDSGGQRTDG